jgi:hypothetical protein
MFAPYQLVSIVTAGFAKTEFVGALSVLGVGSLGTARLHSTSLLSM